MDYNSSTNFTNLTSDFVPDDDADWKLTWAEKVVGGLLLFLISVTGMIGNSMIITAVAFSNKLQTSTNAFVTSLSVADLVTSFFCIWVIVAGVSDGWPIPQAEWLCALTGATLYTCTGTSIYTLGAIAVNRLILITRPILHDKIFTSWKLGILVAIPWIVPLAGFVIFVATGNAGFGFDTLDGTCSDLDSHEKAEIFNLGQTLAGLPIPLLVIVVSYTWIYVYLKRHFRALKRNMSLTVSHRPSTISATVTVGDSGVSPVNLDVTDQSSPREMSAATVQRREQIAEQQIEITKNLFLVVCAFFVCFVPFFIVNAFHKHVYFLLNVLTLANSAINFIIYSRKHPVFKEVLGYMIRCSCADIPQPSRFLKFLLSKKN